MAVVDEASCKIAFAEACNARYEPLYAALEARGLIALSAPGIAACQAHLAAVPCVEQIFDLDGGCAGMWVGQAPPEAACGPGLESFVCDATSTCVLDMSFCGTCRPLAAAGELCDTTRACLPTEKCAGGTCVPRVPAGQPCDPYIPCVLGASCLNDTCLPDPVVAAGDACDAARACPYKSACVQGVCVATALLGEPCGGGVGCASGWCDGGHCAPLFAEGAPCSDSLSCASGRCTGGACGPFALSCVDAAP
jgi:hypothetical protein